MTEILSQSEIDKLLRDLYSGELNENELNKQKEERKIRVHDFRRPSKFSKEHIKALRSIFENYARLETNYLTAYLRTLVQIDVLEVEALVYSDFVNSLANPVIFCIVNFSPLEGNIVFQMSPNIVFAFIDRILGGKGVAAERERDFTEIELVIIERVIVQMLNSLKEPWKDVILLRPVLERVETSAQFAQVVSPNETVALVTFNVKIAEVEGMLSICIPYITVEPIISKLSTRYWVSNKEKQGDSKFKEVIEAGVEKTKVPIDVILGKTSITVSDLLGLQIGDVLPLDKKINSELDMLVGGLRKFRCTAGIHKNRIAVKITSKVGKEDE